MPKKLHLAWFLNFSSPSWLGPFDGTNGEDWIDGDFYVDIVRAMERAKFDYVMFEDSLMVSDVHGGSMATDLKYNMYAPKQDPLPLMAKLGEHTDRIGLVATASTSFYPPFILARLYATLDNLTHGRIGWNVVTSSEDLAAQNFGLDELYEHDQRYEMADEYVGVVKKLWDSWDEGALVRDRETGVFADHTKVHPIHHEGAFFKVRGPLNAMPGPQRQPALCQAGGSPRGRAFAAKHANTIICSATGVAEMKQYRDDIRQKAVTAGRNPDDIKVLYVVTPVLDETDELAQAKAARRAVPSDAGLELALAHLSALTNVDFTQFALDEVPPAITTNGHRTTLEAFLKKGKPDATLRELASMPSLNAVPFVGSPATVARQMEEVMEEVGGDGFLFSGALSRQSVAEIVDGLVPEMQRRGLARTEYEFGTFKENLLAF
ncbi:FMN-dependent oxidoreductase (nitrilotriacetate monooxygenase family) [Frondihabitans sp. PhB188]|uniref:NtaA/DmoA family FMN-dependent monooxygenase n=1 Tax=Frondihabitans sp. PhB188 TaxID=2485200 RepID=UPI000F4AA65F|nr:NtaA/DmoA family FMN-dependent monooxygenase [Frondihabitans sp. PhB188]ROQ39714.1 FMN-dependent oxidoreductase (nitrilotriacetate monooxygenase family) [Frondihabitans sp. PhB188]